MCVGLNKGHKTTKIKQLQYRGDRKVKGIRPSRLKGVSMIRHNLSFSLCCVQCTERFSLSMMKPPLIHSQTVRIYLLAAGWPMFYWSVPVGSVRRIVHPG